MYKSIRDGYYSDVYFERARQIMAKNPVNVKMQVFQKGENTVLAGIEPTLQILRSCMGFYETQTDLEGEEYTPWISVKPGPKVKVEYLPDGTIVQPWEPVLTIEGPYHLFANLETVYLGILARCSKIATNMRRAVDAANGKEVLFFGARFDTYETQILDGYAAKVGGASAVSTPAQSQESGLPYVGTMPHALIAACGGDVVKACRLFQEEFPSVPLIALVDFNNDCVKDAQRCWLYFHEDLYGVRLDTSENMVDKSISLEGDFKPTGVNPQLVHNVRKSLDFVGGQSVKITVSGGFTSEKIAEFERLQVPVDTYAVGSSILKGSIDFTADVVYPNAKMGRRVRNNSRLVKL